MGCSAGCSALVVEVLQKEMEVDTVVVILSATPLTFCVEEMGENKNKSRKWEGIPW